MYYDRYDNEDVRPRYRVGSAVRVAAPRDGLKPRQITSRKRGEHGGGDSRHRCRSSSKIHEDVLLPGSRSHGDHRPFTVISVILQHAAILNTYCRVEAYIQA